MVKERDGEGERWRGREMVKERCDEEKNVYHKVCVIIEVTL